MAGAAGAALRQHCQVVMETASYYRRTAPLRSLRLCFELLIYGALGSVHNAIEFPLLLTCLPTTFSLQFIDIIKFFKFSTITIDDDFQIIR